MNKYSKYYSEDDEEEYVCLTCGGYAGNRVVCPSCLIRYGDKTEPPPDALEISHRNGITVHLNRLMGRRLSKQEVIEVIDLIKYHLREDL